MPYLSALQCWRVLVKGYYPKEIYTCKTKQAITGGVYLQKVSLTQLQIPLLSLKKAHRTISEGNHISWDNAAKPKERPQKSSCWPTSSGCRVWRRTGYSTNCDTWSQVALVFKPLWMVWEKQIHFPLVWGRGLILETSSLGLEPECTAYYNTLFKQQLCLLKLFRFT